jgi:tRNA 2-thiouridine synthesizing protein A
VLAGGGDGVTGRRARLFGRAPAGGQTAGGPTDRPAGGAAPVKSAAAERAELSVPLPAAALVIDALGRKCPIPIIMLAEQIRDIPLGAVVAVLADDPAAYTDIPSWCTMKAHEFVAHSELPQGGWALFIRRRLLPAGPAFRSA